MANYDSIEVVWHGGEPLLLGTDYFGAILSEFRSGLTGKGFDIVHVVQTNLCLLDDSWKRLLIDNNVRVSTSLDLPSRVHNAIRADAKGRGTYSLVLKNIRALQDAGLPVGFVSVISRDNVECPDEVYRSLKDIADDLQVSAQFIPCSVGRTKQGSGYLSDVETLSTFWKRMFDLWVADESPPNVADMAFLCKSILGRPVGLCTFSDDCLIGMLAVDIDGNLWPCCSCIDHDAFKLGTIFDDRATDIVLGIQINNLRDRASRLPLSCRQCEIWPLCQGGCMCSAYEHVGNADHPDPLCPAYKALFTHARNRIHEIIPQLAT